MNREVIKYTLIAMGVITAVLAAYYLYLLYKEQKA